MHLHTHVYVSVCIYTLYIRNGFNIKYISHIFIVTVESLNDRRIKNPSAFLTELTLFTPIH